MKNCLRCNKELYRKENQLDWHWNQQKWCSSNCRSNSLRKGRSLRERNINWNGGKGITSQGYIAILMPNHPSAISRDYILEHRLVMEKHIGRFLKSTEQVHHINHNKKDNRIENLMLCLTPQEHRAQHPITEEIKEKISKKLKGRIFSKEHKNKLSIAMMGNQNGRHI